LNFPISLLSTSTLYILVHDTSFSAANTSFKHSLLIFTPVTGFSIENRALLRKNEENYLSRIDSKITGIYSSLSENISDSLHNAPVLLVGSLFIP